MEKKREELWCKESQILITSAAISELLAYIGTRTFSRLFLISDETLFSLHGQAVLTALKGNYSMPISYFLLESGEKAKTIASAQNCWQQMHLIQMDRASLVISLGGGVVTDLAGFTASCYMRGIEVLHLPTTLLAMVDASIGGKTGVNLPSGKNLVGTFHQPSVVLIDLTYLGTLSKREFSSGLAEVIKCAVIRNVALFDYLETHMEELFALNPVTLHHIISASCRIKAEIVEKDEKEQGLRAILNYGHTFAHAFETATEYEFYAHGEAVSIGMCCAAEVSLKLGLIDASFVKRQEALCLRAGLPTHLQQDLESRELIKLMCRDKKSISGNLTLVLPVGIGSVKTFDAIDPVLVEAVLQLRIKRRKHHA